MLYGKEPAMQPPPTSIFIHADAYRQELLTDFERGRPKLPRELTGRQSVRNPTESTEDNRSASFVLFRLYCTAKARVGTFLSRGAAVLEEPAALERDLNGAPLDEMVRF
jgi:hypothetical protein